MHLSNTPGQTYSFDSAEIVQTLQELVQALTDMGVDIADSAQLQAGFARLFHIEYHNLPNLDAHGYILAPNHISDFDALIMGLLHPHIKIMSKNDWVENPRLMAFLQLHYNLIGIDRDSKVSQARALVEMIKHLRALPGPRHALIFPQGTISDINRNSTERVQSGVFTLSCKAGVPILPVYIEQPNFNHPTRVVFGRPMEIPQLRQDCRAHWQDAVLALQNSLAPPARSPVLTERHANNNKPGDPFF